MQIPSSSPCFVDYISIHQQHSGLPDLDGGRIQEIGDSDEIVWTKHKHLQLPGSYSTSVLLRVISGRVELTGNIGRHGRPDNVFNVDFDKTILRANTLLDCFSLPPFSDDGDYWTDKDGKVRSNGAAVTRLDLTRNYITGGKAEAERFMTWLDGLSLPYIRRGRKVGSTTVQWGSNTGRFKIIAYDKAQEMLDHAKNEEQRALIKETRVFQYCRDNGIVRVELKLGRLELEDKGLRFLGDINMEKLQALFDEKVSFLYGAKANDNLDLTLADLPQGCKLAYSAYMSGVDVSHLLKRRTLYHYGSLLRPYGVDILSAPDVLRLKTKVREITIQAASAPDWYWQEAA